MESQYYKFDSLLELSDDYRLNRLLQTVLKEVKEYAENQIKHLRKGAEIGKALSIERNIDKLLEMIVEETRAISNADAGTLYTLDKEKNVLSFKILQNDTMNVRMGGTSRRQVNLVNVPLYIDGCENHANVSSYVALTGETVNISDVYEAEGFDFSGTRKYDEKTGYRSKSMLVMPLRNHKDEIIGVLQLLNAQDAETGKVVPFSSEYVDLVASLASQAAVALTNTILINDLKNAIETIKKLFDAFIKSMAHAIDLKSTHTGGHINRVAKLTMMIAEQINETDNGPFGEIFFDSNEMEELRLAAWLHDVGKITVYQHVVDKSTKLETVFDRINLVDTRFRLIECQLENEYLKKKNELLESAAGRDSRTVRQLEDEYENRRSKLQTELEFLENCNRPGEYLSEEKMERLKEIAGQTYRVGEEEYPYLTDDELMNLSIRKGTLNDDERKHIENHATLTYEILRELPFPEYLSHVPEYASGHHEKPSGTGYPRGLKGEEMPLQSRIMAIADIFEALTAPDRPYKAPMKLSMAVKILNMEKERMNIDPDVLDLFLDSRLYMEYAKEELKPEQIDEN